MCGRAGNYLNHTPVLRPGQSADQILVACLIKVSKSLKSMEIHFRDCLCFRLPKIPCAFFFGQIDQRLDPAGTALSQKRII
jgi:hypothetical protein